MSKHDIGQEILEGILEIKSFKAGKVSLRTRTLTEPASPQVTGVSGHLTDHPPDATLPSTIHVC